MTRILLILAALTVVISCKKDKPQTTATLITTAVSNITASTATTGGTMTNDGRSAITKSGVCWATHSGSTVSDSITTDVASSGVFTSNLSGLMANTAYYVRAYAINASGTAYGNEVSFTTSKGVPAVTTTAISNNQNLSVATGGNVINDGGATLTATGVVWSTSPHPTTANFKIANLTAGTGVFTDTIKSLNVTTYYLRAYATNSFGTGYGNEIQFTVTSTNTVTDIDGNSYTTVTVGSQVWMGSNLRTSHYKNGDPIVNGFTTANFDWYSSILSTNSSRQGAFTYPNGDSTNQLIYGKLYNNTAVIDSRGICPQGWHIPTRGDVGALLFAIGVPADDTTGDGNYNESAAIAKLMQGGSSGLNFRNAGEWFFPNPATPSAGPWKFFGFETSAGVKIANFWFSGSNVNGSGGEIWNRYLPLESNFPYLTYNTAGVMAYSVRCIKD